MDKIYVGKIVNTHGIKGEIRILSDFQFKDKVFKKDKKLIIDNLEYIIRSYRHHKIFEMVTLNEYNNINDVLFLIGKKVYIDKDELELDDNEILDSDLIKFKVIDSKGIIGNIIDIFYASGSNKILRVMFDREVLIPFNSPMIEKIDILTLFPDMFKGVFSESIIKRAIDLEKVEINLINFRDYTNDLHNKVDDTPYGGGAGMVLMPQPIFDCVKSIKTDDSVVILLTPDGVPYKQNISYNLSRKKHIILICGHYEGFDERIRSICDMEISIGDYVLTGGEIPSMVLVDSIVRLIPGVIREESHLEDSFNDNYLLDYPTYTKPRVYEGMEVPEVLLSGNHEKIRLWRENEALKRTKLRRPDLLEK